VLNLALGRPARAGLRVVCRGWRSSNLETGNTPDQHPIGKRLVYHERTLASESMNSTLVNVCSALFHVSRL
jgi:hypothetical protein